MRHHSMDMSDNKHVNFTLISITSYESNSVKLFTSGGHSNGGHVTHAALWGGATCSRQRLEAQLRLTGALRASVTAIVGMYTICVSLQP